MRGYDPTIARIMGLDVPEPRRDDPGFYVRLGESLLRDLDGDWDATKRGMAFIADENDVKVSVLMAAIRELEVTYFGQRLARRYTLRGGRL